ncbi:hypothetical protein BU23DRAFT_567012 [Bimuria novae-zelandiae CBS 107.79]|uniref:Extracellular membrane protein CFEM domain-containing protein n=1 Tax=Bimuria novae-zelandiae CBS 107.79 TaxID=1447943 RepID=A0A6A5VC31_9PLEO|nr:hypothetical protein BU23DRAFT_567012 [Bimuria novae-zelandiae CBS 107.79]
MKLSFLSSLAALSIFTAAVAAPAPASPSSSTSIPSLEPSTINLYFPITSPELDIELDAELTQRSPLTSTLASSGSSPSRTELGTEKNSAEKKDRGETGQAKGKREEVERQEGPAEKCIKMCVQIKKKSCTMLKEMRMGERACVKERVERDCKLGSRTNDRDGGKVAVEVAVDCVVAVHGLSYSFTREIIPANSITRVKHALPFKTPFMQPQTLQHTASPI